MEGSGLGAWWLAVEEEVEEFETYGVALGVESVDLFSVHSWVLQYGS